MKGGKDPMNRGCFQADRGNLVIFLHYKRLLAFRKQVEDMEELRAMKFQPGYTDGNLYVFHRKGKKCRLLVAVNGGNGCKTLPLKLNNEKIINYFISGDVSFTDLQTFCLKDYSGIAVLIG